jgi:hypothetical protein
MSFSGSVNWNAGTTSLAIRERFYSPAISAAAKWVPTKKPQRNRQQPSRTTRSPISTRRSPSGFHNRAALGPARRHIWACRQRQHDHQSLPGLFQRRRPRHRHRRRHASASRAKADSRGLLPLQPLITLACHVRLSVRQQPGLQSRPRTRVDCRDQTACRFLIHGKLTFAVVT